MLLHGCNTERGTQLLDKAEGRLRLALSLAERRGADSA